MEHYVENAMTVTVSDHDVSSRDKARSMFLSCLHLIVIEQELMDFADTSMRVI